MDFLVNFMDFMKIGLTSAKNVLTLLAKNTLIPSEITTSSSVANSRIHKKKIGSGVKLVISIEKMEE